MKKRKKGRKLSRKRDQRKALLKNLAESLILKEKIKTTEAKAKEVRIFIEKAINLAKENKLAKRRLLLKKFSNQTAKKIMEVLAPKYKERKGGYTRIIKLGQRKSDGARMAIIELIK